jgi:eukaryotic-like serine/threonine-protein kinase
MEAGTLSGRYETAERLGSGGMSNVYKATDRILERQVAVKILAEHLSDDERFVARFRREALAVARLIHPNIVQVYDSGVDDGRHYIVMEYVAGRSGAQILQRHGPVDADTAAEIGIQACAGLDYAHRRGIIHRDVKPGNLMITGGPVGNGELVVKLTDFGIARAIEQTRITQVGSVVGTAAYLSPEQVRGDEATPGTDVYALGVVLYQFLTGRLPYEGSSLAELAVRQQNEKPLPPSTYNSEVPETLSAAVLRALEGDTSRRYASADEFATGLQMGLEGEDVTRIESLGGEGNTPTRVLGGDTAATRHLDRTTAQTEYRPAPPPARRLEPRREPEPRRAAPYAGDPQPARAQPNYAPAPPRKRSAFSKFVRFILALIALVLVAGAVATGVILTTDKAAGVHISKVAGDTVDKVVEEFKGLVSKNKE